MAQKPLDFMLGNDLKLAFGKWDTKRVSAMASIVSNVLPIGKVVAFGVKAFAHSDYR